MAKIKHLYEVKYCGNKLTQEIKTFIEFWHYSESARSMKQEHIFTLVNKSNNKLIGVCVFGQPISRNAYKIYGNSLIELRKLCLIDKTPKNTESYFIGAAIRWLKRNTKYKTILSYSDPNMGHVGTIYKASNFEYKGFTTNNTCFIYEYKGKTYHKRQVYQKKNGKYLKSAKELQELLKDWTLKKHPQMPKLAYIYKLKDN